MKAPPRRDRILVLLLAALLVSAFLWSQRTREPEAGAGPVAAGAARTVAMTEVRRISVPVYAEGIGTVRSRRQTVIAARMLAEILEVRVSPGDRVQVGDLLVLLDSRDLEARVGRFEAELRAADEALADARTDLERARNLLAREAATQQELDRASTAEARAVAARDGAAQSLTGARAQLADARVTAPFSGLIHARSVDPGDLATPGRALLELHDPEAMRLEAQVEERLLWSLEPGAAVTLSVDALEAGFTGTVDEIVPAIDPLTRTGIVKIALPPLADLRPGMFGRARLVTGEREAIVAPAAALVRRGQLALLFTSDAGADHGGAPHARLLLVRAGRELLLPGSDAPWVELLAGVEAGTPVVVEGAAELYDGAPLRIAADRDAGR